MKTVIKTAALIAAIYAASVYAFADPKAAPLTADEKKAVAWAQTALTAACKATGGEPMTITNGSGIAQFRDAHLRGAFGKDRPRGLQTVTCASVKSISTEFFTAWLDGETICAKKGMDKAECVSKDTAIANQQIALLK